MTKTVLILIGLLLLSSACVSRTTTADDGLTGERKDTTDTKLIWFWQDEFSQ